LVGRAWGRSIRSRHPLRALRRWPSEAYVLSETRNRAMPFGWAAAPERRKHSVDPVQARAIPPASDRYLVGRHAITAEPNGARRISSRDSRTRPATNCDNWRRLFKDGPSLRAELSEPDHADSALITDYSRASSLSWLASLSTSVCARTRRSARSPSYSSSSGDFPETSMGCPPSIPSS